MALQEGSGLFEERQKENCAFHGQSSLKKQKVEAEAVMCCGKPPPLSLMSHIAVDWLSKKYPTIAGRVPGGMTGSAVHFGASEGSSR